ncbi:MAG: hypothetical protein J0G32_01080 [Alphaproteobacteria bacterium]|nr:hypothetical protein [Alphaproteobacteria bacterium]OJV13211.1 MAG: hypothetical protein BGO27_00200 [Alphaproteobacteria bacterium 33-17]
MDDKEPEAIYKYTELDLNTLILPDFINACLKGDFKFVNNLFISIVKPNITWLITYNNFEAFNIVTQFKNKDDIKIVDLFLKLIPSWQKNEMLISAMDKLVTILTTERSLAATKMIFNHLSDEDIKKTAIASCYDMLYNFTNLHIPILVAQRLNSICFIKEFQKHYKQDSFTHTFLVSKKNYIKLAMKFQKETGIDVSGVISSCYNYYFYKHAIINEIMPYLEYGYKLCKFKLKKHKNAIIEYCRAENITSLDFDTFKVIINLYRQISKKNDQTYVLKSIQTLPVEIQSMITTHLEASLPTWKTLVKVGQEVPNRTSKTFRSKIKLPEPPVLIEGERLRGPMAL